MSTNHTAQAWACAAVTTGDLHQNNRSLKGSCGAPVLLWGAHQQWPSADQHTNLRNPFKDEKTCTILQRMVEGALCLLSAMQILISQLKRGHQLRWKPLLRTRVIFFWQDRHWRFLSHVVFSVSFTALINPIFYLVTMVSHCVTV